MFSRMTLRMLSLSVLLVPLLAARGQAPEVVPRAGLVITQSVRLRPGTYRMPAPASLDSALITVRGAGVTVDMRGVRLVGLDEEADPDRAQGVALRIEGGHDVRVTGATIRGYRFGILARGTRGLVLDSNDVSFGWKPRLFSLVAHESLVDWLSFHKNEGREWMRFGAAMYLDDVRGGEVRGNVARQGMNGLLLVRAESLLVHGNELSFNSGLGIGMYRSSRNRIAHNRVDYDVRGYSHGFYRRGQDSAGILMFEQCSENVVAYNSVTHGGDGLFLWAGQHTMDTGEGGSNDNVVWGNDLSFAPTNGIEATFSRNTFVANRVEGSDHGLWGGYSWESRVLGNRFARNRIGIAWEHGQSNEVAWNVFEGDTTALRLWADSIAPSDWGYPKRRDTRSRDWVITHNRFDGNRVGVRASNTTGRFADNTLVGVDSALVRTSGTGPALGANAMVPRAGGAAWLGPALPDSLERLAPPRSRGAFSPDTQRLASAARRPRSAIVVDEWGPYDWRSPKLWPADSGRGDSLRLQVLGPAGRWHVVGSRGVLRVSRAAGRVPDTISVTLDSARRGDWSIALEYRGARTVSPRGTVRAAGAPVRFAYERFEPRADWRVRWAAWDSTADPVRDPAALDRTLRGPALLEQQVPRLDWLGYGAPAKGLPRERLAMEAITTLVLPPGRYTLRAISDDAVRVWVDGRLAIDAWAPHESRVDYAPLSGGRRELRVQYLNVGGWYELRLELLRGEVARSAGSPGPH